MSFTPGLGFSYSDLFEPEGLGRLDELFLQRLAGHAPERQQALRAWREGREFGPVETSELLLACAPVLEELLVELFGIREQAEALRERTLGHGPVFDFKKRFVLRRARRRLARKEDMEGFAELDAWLDRALAEAGLAGPDRELAVARLGRGWLEDLEQHKEEVERLTRWCIRALSTPEGRAAVAGWVSFRLPGGTDWEQRVPVEPVAGDPLGRVQSPRHRPRDGFKLTDPRMGPRQVQAEIDYCIYCHDHDGDFCSKGFPEKKGEPERGLKKNPLGVTLTGCPLEEKISEMHTLKRDGFGLAALAMVMVDNPMCPATGHRICNDCMTACIYQKQEPVNIPEIETRVLTDVLELPWGVEIYDLLTRWNPLRRRQWLPRPYNGLKVLIAGMGPAGFTLAHHLLMEGFAVVGIDGLKIEPLPECFLREPVRDWSELCEELDERVMAGFGGVAEYGITVRWDKNFLRLIYLNLSRRRHFQAFGGVRFGGTVTVETAWELGFDHVAIAVGAGLPQALPIPGSLAPGMRQANDFLMALQLSGAAKASGLANLQVRLPAVVIGGGLTGVDTATELQAYYIVQVEKILHRYERLAQERGEAALREGLDPASLAILDEYLEHGRAVRRERERARAAGEAPDLAELVRRWGGVTIAYRRRLKDSPAYVRNHEEVIKALEEGIYYAECLEPVEARLDAHGHVESLVCRRMRVEADGTVQAGDEQVTLPARAILVATGARPNIAYHFEHRGALEVKDFQYVTHTLRDGALEPVGRARHCKDPAFGPFTSYNKDGRYVSFVGDTHPDFSGNVVKAVASGLRSYPRIADSFGERLHRAGDPAEYAAFRERLEGLLRPRVEAITRHGADIIELTVRAPLAARRFQPGQIFRLQNFESRAPLVDGTRLQTETVALTGSRVDKEKGLLSFVIRERGASTRLLATLQPGDPLTLMGPSGVRTRIHEQATVLLAGDWLAATDLRALGPALKAAGSRVLFVAVFDRREQLFCRGELEAASDAILWITREGEPVRPGREQDAAATGDPVEVLARYAAGELGAGPAIPLQEVDKLHLTGTAELVRRFNEARRGALAPYLSKQPETTGSVYSTMQCMLKGVCSQCLQWQVDPATGRRKKAVFACSWQDEPIDLVDFDALDDRLGQNRLQEALSARWLDYLFQRHGIERV